MSYEGYVQKLCEKGHYFEVDCYEDSDKIILPCGDRIVWHNGVDLTNGSFEDNKRIDGYVHLRIKHERKCDHCGSVLETIYELPEEEAWDIF